MYFVCFVLLLMLLLLLLVGLEVFPKRPRGARVHTPASDSTDEGTLPPVLFGRA
jgi:hypothetical protein